KPSITNMSGTVTVFFPGASPRRVEALVTRPLEDELRQIPEIDQVQSISRTGVSTILILLVDTLSDEALDRAWSEVRDAIDDARGQFPTGVGEPDFENDRLTAFTSILAFSAAGDTDMPLSLLSRLAQDFADRARAMEGTRLVEVFGEPAEEIRVEADQRELVARGLGIRDVAAALRAADAKVASGRATGAGNDLLIEMAGELDSMERVRQVIVATSAAGSATRVGDIARVFKTEVSPPQGMAIAQGRPALLVGAIMERGRQVDTWTRDFRALTQEYMHTAPAGLKVEVTFEQEGYARQRLIDVTRSLALGVTLVLLVLLFTMGWRAAVVVAVALPVCGFAAIATLERMGVTLDQLSISGLIVAIGLLVDGAIVMTDEVRKRLIAGAAPVDAISGSVDRLRVPLIASALTTVLTFMPMAIMPGPSGDFLGNLSWAVIIMLLASTLMALLVTPVLAIWLLPRTGVDETPWYAGGVHSGRGGERLRAALDWSLRHPWGAIALALALPLSGLLAFPTLTAQFFPGTDRDQLYVQVKLPDGRSIYDTHELVQSLDARLRSDPLIRRVDWTLGESAPAFFYNMYRFYQGVPSWAEALVLTRDENLTDDLVRRLQDEFNRTHPAARIVVRGMDEAPPMMAPLEVELHGPNLETLRELGEQYRRRLESIPNVTHTTVDLIGGAPKLEFQLDEDKLRLARLQLTDAAAALNDSLSGLTGGEILEGNERLPVRVRLAEKDWGTLDQIGDLRLPTMGPPDPERELLSGVPLSALGTASLVPARSPITRLDGEYINTIAGYITRGVLPLEVLKVLQDDLAANPIALPPGYKLVYGGDADAREDTVSHIMAPLGLILAAMLATILVTFNSWRLSAIAFLVCICSFGLSLLSLAVFNYPFGIMALTGVIGSIGVSINAAIIIMTGLQRNQAAVNGDLRAVRNVVMDSSRHILSTTATTFGGFLPLILEGSQYWPPFAMAIAGGVLLSTIISFFLVPPLYTIVHRRGSSELPQVERQESAVRRAA
ncbi:MAG: efflux RND transporter permease subunit, partial [Halioglobus sp.]|nr:efflux RND transporter permease subunit [Halioglobus sp.]